MEEILIPRQRRGAVISERRYIQCYLAGWIGVEPEGVELVDWTYRGDEIHVTRFRLRELSPSVGIKKKTKGEGG